MSLRSLPPGRPARGRAVLAALVAACAVAVAGCSGVGTTVPAAAATPVPTSGDSTLAAGLLTVDDLPLGFQPQDGAAGAAALGCAGIDGVYLPAGSSAHATASFAHSLSAAFVNETVTLRPGGAAAAALGRFAAAATACKRFSGPDGIRYAVAPVSLPRYGDGSAAVRVRSGLAEGREVELAAVRVGDVLVAVAAAGTGDGDGALTRTVLDRALAKLSRAGVTTGG
jgi:hypothetical protein